jgi:hypothetical protein
MSKMADLRAVLLEALGQGAHDAVTVVLTLVDARHRVDSLLHAADRMDIAPSPGVTWDYNSKKA